MTSKMLDVSGHSSVWGLVWTDLKIIRIAEPADDP